VASGDVRTNPSHRSAAAASRDDRRWIVVTKETR
jgi:hypothetical protein